jgi:mannose-1-phosphate guanylyltransferase
MVSRSGPKAVVLTGGLGTRLRPVTFGVPKQLIPVAGKPVLLHTLDLLPEDVEEVVLAAGYKGGMLESYLRSNPYRLPTRVVIEDERKLLGTGGAMKNAARHLSDPFFFLYADTIASVPLEGLLRRHQETRASGVMALYEVEDTRPYGVAALGPGDRITSFIEKPAPEQAPSRWINAGFAIWRREVLDGIPVGREVSFEREILPQLLGSGVYGLRFSGYFVDGGTLAGVLAAQRVLFDAGRGGSGRLPPGATGDGPVATMDGATARGATLGKYVTLGSNARVAPGAHVENSVVMENAVVERGARVTGSLLGPGVTIPAGARIDGVVLATESSRPTA